MVYGLVKDVAHRLDGPLVLHSSDVLHQSGGLRTVVQRAVLARQYCKVTFLGRGYVPNALEFTSVVVVFVEVPYPATADFRVVYTACTATQTYHEHPTMPALRYQGLLVYPGISGSDVQQALRAAFSLPDKVKTQWYIARLYKYTNKAIGPHIVHCTLRMRPCTDGRLTCFHRQALYQRRTSLANVAVLRRTLIAFVCLDSSVHS